eukprot:TRINITY_DN6733_c0_g1_i1.p1 TRINITY_DN6733_c0_g1~~TRINITY_DN6733_c0_g1_i1.p1  ORF type:complete len:693 (+),score=155.43 TRINITY_DN6733_c0_g1_i1:100-2178(+)
MDFPADLTQSMWGDVVKQCGGDAAKARAMWTGVSEENDRAEKDRKIRTLANNFPTLDKGIIEEHLAANDWDVDAAVLPLWQVVEKIRDDEKRRRDEAEAKQRQVARAAKQKEANEQARMFLRNLFAQVAEDKIQDLLDKNEGDVSATTDQLLQFTREQSREAELQKLKQEQELMRKQAALDRQLKFDNLKARFSEFVSEEEIAEALEKGAWDLKEVTRVLLTMTEARKLEQLQRLFGALSNEQIRQALAKHQWDIKNAMVELRQVQAEMRKAAQTPEPVIVQQPVPEPVSVPEPVQEPELERTPTAEEQERMEALMNRSAILEKELTEIIEAQREEARALEPEAIFKKILEDKLRFGPEAVPGLPGMVPLTPKIIDQMQGKKPFENSAAPVAPAKEALPDEKGEPDVKIASNVTLVLKASPAVVDLGQKITVEWDAQAFDGTYAPTTSDWIAMYKVGAQLNQYSTWNWIGKASPQGSITFAASEFGKFVFRYFAKSRTNLLATSEPISIGPQYDMSANQVGEQKKIAVKITQQSGAIYPNAWVGMFDASQPDNRYYLTYQWCSTAVDNMLIFDVPKTGKYDFRLFPLKSYIHVSHCTLDLHGQDSLQLRLEGGLMTIRASIKTVDPAVESAWIGLYLTGERDQRQYKKYKYVTVAEGEVTFVAPKVGGLYDVRLFANKTLEPVVTSNSVRIE